MFNNWRALLSRHRHYLKWNSRIRCAQLTQIQRDSAIKIYCNSKLVRINWQRTPLGKICCGTNKQCNQAEVQTHTIVHVNGIMLNLLKLSGFFTYTTTRLNVQNSTWCSLCVECFVRVSEQTAAIVVYVINWLVFITVVVSVYSTVRTDSLYKADYVSALNG